MNGDEGGIKFVNCIGSDINIWRKLPYDENYECETCLLYDEPEYHLDDPECVNTTWKFFDHITKRYLLGNGKEIFHYQKYECPPLIVKISTPLYTLQELCKYTISTRLLVNNISNTAIDEMELPEQFKIDIKSCVQKLREQYDADGDDCIQDWTVYHEEEYHY
ncbi:uncharacterized protein LOC111033261 [Myzus persicae]|uniref:uncharacterized protein LOC111033261 n=1 Tax=Myzus persicae TaxID=13164 RepID=UPI000B9326BD|nr:uncharacterized protein LOC111033261 [Myzus persicae]XP_022169619.1 uncharacterized protein LOC111033261 [Myzus persicae]XP_022169620.1 uncharacterized protein LOC111033261 [Myzus persicae]